MYLMALNCIYLFKVTVAVSAAWSCTQLLESVQEFSSVDFVVELL